MSESNGEHVSPSEHKEGQTVTLDEVYEQALQMQDGEERTFHVDHDVSNEELNELMDRIFYEGERQTPDGPRNMIDWTQWTREPSKIVAKCRFRDPLWRDEQLE